MSVLDKFENSVEGAVDRAAGAVFKAPIQPAQIAKVAVKQMKQHRLVGSGRQYAPTLYNVLVNESDDKRLFGFYPTMASEIETHLLSKGTDLGLEFDGRPLVRFIADPKLKRGRFDVIVENVSAQIIVKLREEELEYYGLKKEQGGGENRGYSASRPFANPSAAQDALLASPSALFSPSASSVNPADSITLLPPLSAGRLTGGATNLADDATRRPQSPAHPGDPSRDDPSRSDQPQSSPSQSEHSGGETSGAPSLGSATLYNTTNHETHPLLTRQVILGRELGCGITVNDANASRQHAVLRQNAAGAWKLIDLDSTNGTLLNDQPVTQAALRDGDQITIGTSVLEFQQ
jgi:hypothetical protein